MSNEVTAIPKLIDSLELKGNTISIDAMGCQKDIARRIIGKGAHYLLAVKKNQGRLLEDIEDTTKLEKPNSIYTETSGYSQPSRHSLHLPSGQQSGVELA